MGLKIYLVHSERSPEREELQKAQLVGKEFEFVTDEPENVPVEQIKHPFMQDVVSKSEVSCIHKHHVAYKRFLETEDSHAIIFEDDAIINENFDEDVKRVFKECPAFHLCFLSGDYFDDWKVKVTDFIYRTHSAKTGCAYIVSRDGAKRLLENAYPISKPIDWWINGVVEKEMLDCFWAMPGFVENASQTGKLNNIMYDRK